MQGKLQQSYRVSKELGQNSEFNGRIALARLPRLSSLVIPDDAEIEVTFEFTINLYQHPSIKGHIDTELQLECQRCLQPMAHKLSLDFDLLIDASDEDVQSFKIDTVFSDEGYLDVYEVIEDELILALPLISMHEDSACNKNWTADTLPDDIEPENNPFAVLQTLKGK